MSKKKKGIYAKLAKETLAFLYETARGFPLPLETPYQHQKRLLRQVGGYPELKRWQFNTAVRNLKKSKDAIVKDDFIELTQKGKIKALIDLLEGSGSKNQKWDGKWRLIIWDIPEHSRNQRDLLRKFVKTQGFIKLQQSVFIRPYPLSGLAVDFLDETKLSKYIRFLRVDKVDNDRQLKKEFNL